MLLAALAQAAAFAAAPAPAPVTTPAPAPPAPAPQPALVKVALTTAQGRIVLALEKERAPVTTANFLRYVDAKRYDGISFYRAVKVQPGYGLVQGGVWKDGKRLFPAIAHEPTTRTGLSHTDGAISMGRNAPGTATGDFFIVVGGFPSMDADPKAPGDNQGFAVFGRVVEGMDLVRTLLESPTSADAGDGVMKGQIIAQPVKILTARRID
nr:peptidylprolyl isomerase [Sphingomonas jatrophae]